MAQFAENLKKLPGISHLAAINLLDANGEPVAVIENKAGSQGSLAVYNYLAQIYGAITPEAARKGLELYAEHTEDAICIPASTAISTGCWRWRKRKRPCASSTFLLFRQSGEQVFRIFNRHRET